MPSLHPLPAYTTRRVGSDLEVFLQQRFTQGEFDAFLGVMELIRHSGARRIVIDLEQTEMLDSGGVALLVMAFDLARRHGLEPVLRNVRGLVRQVTAAARLQDLFTMA